MPGTLPGVPATKPITLISSLPGVAAHATYIGLYGEYFGQDRVTVLAGRLPPQASTTTVMLTPALAKTFGTGVGGTVSYQFRPVNAQGQPADRRFTRSYRVAAIVQVPPALVDDSDEVEGSILGCR